MTTSIPSNTSSNDTVPGFLGRRPWLFVVAAFVMLISAWSVLFYIAMNNQPQSVPLKHLEQIHP